MANLQENNPSVSEVLDALKEIEGETRTGAQLHSLIKRASPGIDIRAIVDQPTGPGALTKFIGLHLGTLVRRVGMRGGDVLYSIGTSDIQPNTADPGIWKAFVSPSAVNYLCLRKSDMSLFVSEFERDDDDVELISKVTGDEHDEVRANFLTTISDDEKTKLNAKTEGDASYDAFASALRAIGLAGKWGHYRRVAFRELLSKRLKSLAVSDEDMPGILSQFGEAQNTLHNSLKATKSARELNPDSPLSIRSSSPVKSESDQARSLAQAVIANLSYDELRAINIPFGAVLDAVRDSK
jgi:hypothetical protein